ncbi:MAG: 2-hydroxyacyl-CoA dehydratase [Desulfobacteraceae bacterium]|nr:2-hydroxyacyl-CoA dehydratase [Desulfobacteraceae bacterium]
MEAQSQIQFRKFDFSKKLDLETDILRMIEQSFKESVSQQDESIQWLFQPYIGLIDEMVEAAKNPERIVYHNFPLPPEIIYGMDLSPFSHEVLPLLCPTEYAAAYKDRAIAHLVPEHLCSFVSAALGVALSNAMPKPAAIIHASHPCDSGIASCQALAEYYGIKPFILDSPYDDSKEAHEYFASQIKDCLSYLEEMTGKSLDLDKMREALKKSDRAHELMYQFNELKKRKPCPIISSTILRAVTVAMWQMAGSENTIQWLERVVQDANQRAEKGIGGRYEEKMRIAWIYTLPTFDPAIFQWMEEKFGAISVIFQSADHTYWSNYKPVRKADYDYSLDEICTILADKSLNSPMARQARGHFDYFLRDAVHWCRDWDIDAAIFSGHIHCKSNWSCAQLAKEVLMDELGLPTLIYEIDILDPRVTSAEQVVGLMEPFLEMVAENKGL